MKTILIITVLATVATGCKKSEFSSSIQRLKPQELVKNGAFDPKNQDTWPKDPYTNLPYNPNDPSTWPKDPKTNLPYNPGDSSTWPKNPTTNNPYNPSNPNDPNNPNNPGTVNPTPGGSSAPSTDYKNGSDNAGTDLMPKADGSGLLIGSGFSCTGFRAGMIGRVYRVPVNSSALPNFSAMTSIGTVKSNTLNVPARKWTSGFPGVPSLIQWFGIQFYAVLIVPETNTYKFTTISDDGSKVYINNVLVVNNDGIHAPAVASGAPMQLTKGVHLLKVDWYQGPPTEIALQLFWSKAGGPNLIVPATSMIAPENCTETNLGSFN